MIKTKAEDPIIRKASDAVFELSADTVLQERIRQREKAINDYYNDISIARKEGNAEEQIQSILDQSFNF